MNKSKANSSSIFNLTIRLVIITVCAGLILGLVYAVTKDPIAEQELKKATEARQMVMQDATDFEPIALDGVDYDHEKYAIVQEVYKAVNGDQTLGYTFALTTKGYKPGLNLTVGLTMDGKVTGVEIGTNDETPGLGANATKPEFLEQFVGTDGPLTVGKTPTGAENEIQALTGATITSKGVANAVNSAREFMTQYLGEGA